ncbi:MAG: bifunctional diaminohydroxyphosphoribosylaminopyrimidine deaminase/5-amino-6-(5-phosphoribosylamino)uracil reductase RibD [Candidatus Zixiibacteriota bacterium]|nr:MAG: bifunctional diaminohydroxyphosphoribosylaminopyrimidine deaminase/5-amino-6-(5-phosphoribosylamino)uracil reductase RibD [candidate division Zixibacteria bacterium]
MRLALRQARRGIGHTSPNPRVGAVLVRDGRVIARGAHLAYGGLHAEAEALARIPAGAARGATLYVTLEPCCHHGKTPPCTQALIQAGLGRVVYASGDPNPLVNGQGLIRLQEAGIRVDGPLLEEPARHLNRGYLKYRRLGRPWVTLKWAQSLDGRIAAAGGDSRWISCPDSLTLAHRLRADNDAVMIGINTARADDPQLTVRLVPGRDPVRVVLDANLNLNPDATLFESGSGRVIVVTRPYPPDDRAQALKARGADLVWAPVDEQGHLDLGVVLDELGRRGILYLLVEGGAQVLASFLRTRLYDEIVLVTAPILVGGDGIACTGPLGVTKVAQAHELEIVRRKLYGRDLALWLEPKQPMASAPAPE